MTDSLRDFHNNFIQGIGPGELVSPEMYLVSYLTNEVMSTLSIDSSRVHIRSIALKHIYEKRNAYEYDVIIDNLPDIIRYPNCAYRDLALKKGQFILVKQISGSFYACVLNDNAHPETGTQITVVLSAFKTTQSYLKKFELIQSWKGGTPSS